MPLSRFCSQNTYNAHPDKNSFNSCLVMGSVWLVLMVIGGLEGVWKLVILSFFMALAFVAGAGAKIPSDPGIIRRIDAAAAGAMLFAALFLVLPHAFYGHAVSGLIGLTIGIMGSFAFHRFHHKDAPSGILGAMTVHSFCDGIILGALNTMVPTLGWSVGIAILAHKTPAGYVVSRQLADHDRSQVLIMLPALATGTGALLIALIPAAASLSGGLVLGIAAGTFFFVALEFLVSRVKIGKSDVSSWLSFGIGAIAILLIGALTPHGV